LDTEGVVERGRDGTPRLEIVSLSIAIPALVIGPFLASLYVWAYVVCRAGWAVFYNGMEWPLKIEVAGIIETLSIARVLGESLRWAL
jgi:hypothetical protein